MRDKLYELFDIHQTASIFPIFPLQAWGKRLTFPVFGGCVVCCGHFNGEK